MAKQKKQETAQPTQPAQPAQAPATQPAQASAPQSAPATQPAQASAPQSAPATQPAQAPAVQTAQAPSQAATAQPAGGAQADAKKEEKPGKAFFIAAIVCTALGGLFFGLTFTPLAVYSLLASILFCICSLSLLGTQKKRENFKGVTILTLITYILLALFIAFFVVGIILTALA